MSITMIKLTICNFIFNLLLANASSSTHWMVTENGLIQPREISPFELEHPQDLLAFLNQGTRWENIINMYHDLLDRTIKIRKLWRELDKETDVTAHLERDANCLEAGPLDTVQWYITSVEDGKTRGISDEDYKLETPGYRHDTDVPDCKKISSLTFSMFVFEHLEAMSQRENLTMDPTHFLPKHISTIMNVDQVGHWLANTLRQNTSSWVHYNLAALYWQVKGNAIKAVECSRRAVLYAPREYKDIVLLNLGVTFHHSRRREDALVLFNAAIEHKSDNIKAQMIIGNAYAALGDFNNSMKHYDICLKAIPGDNFVLKNRNGAHCVKGLLPKMKRAQKLISDLREWVTEYDKRELKWLTSQTALLRTMKHDDEHDYFSKDKNSEKISKMTGLNIKGLRKEGMKNSMIIFFLEGSTFNQEWFEEKGVYVLDSALDLRRFLRDIEKHTDINEKLAISPIAGVVVNGTILEEIGPIPEFSDLFKGLLPVHGTDYTNTNVPQLKPDDKNFEFEGGIVLYPPSMKIMRHIEEFDRDPEWPSNKFCKDAAPEFPPKFDAILPTFIPFENKGIRLKTLLSDMIGVPLNVEHDLPWHPPTCPQEKEVANMNMKKNQKSNLHIVVAQTNYLKIKLLEYVGNGDAESVQHMQEAEIGQRIYNAMKMELASKWLLYTLASLYWRTRNNNINALNCLIGALKSVPTQYKDLVLTSLASVYLELGYFDEAMNAAEDAFKMGFYEPATNLVIAELNMIKEHRKTQMFHLKQVVRVEPTFMGGLVRGILNAWACVLKRAQTPDLNFKEGAPCTQVDSDICMVCENDGTTCHLTDGKCFQNKETTDAFNVRRRIPHTSFNKLDNTVFDEIIENMPKRRSDKLAHLVNYDRMIHIMDGVAQQCAENGCFPSQNQEQSLNEEDCSYRHIQLGYWLHVISFAQLISDAKTKLFADILSLQPSFNKIPECHVPEDTSDDFLLDRLNNIDTDGWEPELELMYQLSENFNNFDYLSLGYKIAAYIEMKPDDRLGLMAAGWWCGASGYGPCAVRCLRAAARDRYEVRDQRDYMERRDALLSLVALLQVQSKSEDAVEVANLMFYFSPKSKLEAFLVAVSHTNVMEFEKAVWMYRYALTFDSEYMPAHSCLHATLCLILHEESEQTDKLD